MKGVVWEIGDYLIGRANKLTKDSEQAKDLVQDTLLKCLEMKDRYDNLHIAQQRQVALTTMRRIFLDNERAKKAKKRTLVDDYPTSHVHQENIYDNKRLKSILDKHFSCTPVKAYILFYSGYSVKEISIITGKAASTTKSNIWRGKRRLREILASEHQNTKEDILNEMSTIINNSYSFYQIIKQCAGSQAA